MKYNKEEIKKKIELEKQKKALKDAEPEMILTMPIPEIKGFDKYDKKVTENLTKLYTEIEKLYTVVDKALEKESINNESLIEVNNSLVTLQQSLLEKGLRVKHINKLEEVTKSAIENLKEIKLPKKLDITNVAEIKQLPKWLASEESLKQVNKNLANIAEQLGNLETNPPGQNPEDFVPFRRVYMSGNRLVFDDTSWSGARGGGGSGGGGVAGEVIIKDAGGEQATVTNGKLDVNATVSTTGLATDTNQTNGSQKTQIVDAGGEVATVTGGKLDVNASVSLNIDSPAIDLFGSAIGGSRYNQVEIDFSTTDPDAISDLTVTKTSTGDASTSGGQATFTTGANTSGGVKAVTNTSVKYRPHAESYAAFTAIFSAGLANSYQRIGIYDTNNGFFIGYEGTSFGVTKRTGAVDTTTAQASFSEDTLTGQVGSEFTRNGTPETADFTKDNLFRIRYGWLGAASIYFEIYSPDGQWVTFHIIKYPNSASVPTVANPNLPITLDVQKSTAGATVLTMKTACWAAGTTSNFQKVTDTITDNTLATLNRAVITGYSTAGGGTYNNVKVTPSGSLTTAIGDITGIVGQNTMANSIPVTIASNQSAVAISAASLPLPTLAATSTKQSDGSQKTQVVDGSGNVIGATSNALDINIKSGNPTTIAVTQATASSLNATVKTDQTTHGTTDLVAADITKVNGSAVATGNGTASGSIRVALPTDGTGVVGLNAGTNLVGKVSSSNETSTMYDGTTALTPKFAAISAASSGNNTLIAANATKKLRILAINFISAAANNIYITNGAGGTALWAGSTNKANFGANGGIVLPYNPVGWFETSANTALVANLSAASAIGGSITYVEV